MMCYNSIIKEVVLMPMSADEMIRLLEKNGFEFVRANGSHRFYRNKQTGATTVVPYHKGDLKSGVERQIKKQAGLK